LPELHVKMQLNSKEEAILQAIFWNHSFYLKYKCDGIKKVPP